MKLVAVTVKRALLRMSTYPAGGSDPVGAHSKRMGGVYVAVTVGVISVGTPGGVRSSVKVTAAGVGSTVVPRTARASTP